MIFASSMLGLWKVIIVAFKFEFKDCYKINNLIKPVCRYKRCEYHSNIKALSFTNRNYGEKIIESNNDSDIYNDIKLTGKRVDLSWEEIMKPIQFKSEEKLKKVLIRKGEYISGLLLPEQRINEITKVCIEENTSLVQALSLRKQLLTTKTMHHRRKLLDQQSFIYTSYNQGMSISKLSKTTDLPAITIFRFILDKRIRKHYDLLNEKEIKNIIKWALRFGNSTSVPSVYDITMKVNNIEIAIPLSLLDEDNDPDSLNNKSKVLDILSENKFWINIMNQRDINELVIAKSIDQVSYNENYLLEQQGSVAWENSLYDYLNNYNISYLTENEMRKLPTEINWNITPDVIFLDDCYINGMLIRWIDCKSYYGSTQAKLFSDKLNKQINRYNKVLQVREQGGYGSIVYRLGYSDRLRSEFSNDVLILDRGPLVIADIEIEEM